MSLLYYGCAKKSLATDGDPITSPPPTTIKLNGQVTIKGTALSDGGAPAENVTVSIDGNTIVTNSAGIFTFTGKAIDSNKVVVKFTKTGYFDAYRTLVVESNATYSGLSVNLLSETTAGNFTATNGGSVSVRGATFTFQPNSVIKDDGSIYTGIVNVYIPADHPVIINSEIPGDMRGTDANKMPVVLESYGGMVIKLKGQTGENLKLSKPMTYAYTFGFVSNPIQTVKLWVFDGDSGIWKEDSLASLVNGNYYSGSTTALTFLQLAVPHPPALLRAHLPNVSGFSLVNTSNQYNNTGTQRTRFNSNNVCLLYIPALLPSTLGLYTPCGDFVTAFSCDALTAGIATNRYFTVDLSKYLSTITGKIYDCDGVLFSGRAEITVNGNTYSSAVTNGSYSFKIISCQALGAAPSTAIRIYDLNNRLITTIPNYTIAAGVVYNAGDINLCQHPITGTVTITAEGKTYKFNTPKDTIKFYSEYQTLGFFNGIYASNATQSFGFSTQHSGVGSFPLATQEFYIPGTHYAMTWGLYPAGTVNITKYHSGTTIIEGNFKTTSNVNYCYCSADREVEISASFKLEQ